MRNNTRPRTGVGSVFRARLLGVAGLTILVIAVSAHAEQKPLESDEWIEAQNSFTVISVALGQCVRGYARSQVFAAATPEQVADAGLKSCSDRAVDWRKALLESMRLEERDSGKPMDRAVMQQQADKSLQQFQETLRKSAISTVVEMRRPK